MGFAIRGAYRLLALRGIYFYLRPGAMGRLIEFHVGDQPMLVFYQAPAEEEAAYEKVAAAAIESMTFSK
jgi:hypothetical protein